MTRRDGLGNDLPVALQGVGQFLAEVGQLSGKPAFVDGRAQGEVEALLIAPERLRTLLVAEAEMGELIMHALILRRVTLIETGAGGPVPTGITGQALAGRAFVQAEKFGAEVVVPVQVERFDCGDGTQRRTHALDATRDV